MNIQQFETHMQEKGTTWDTALIKKDLDTAVYHRLTANTGEQLAVIGEQDAKFKKQLIDYEERAAVAYAAYSEYGTDNFMAKLTEANSQLAIVNDKLAELAANTNSLRKRQNGINKQENLAAAERGKQERWEEQLRLNAEAKEKRRQDAYVLMQAIKPELEPKSGFPENWKEYESIEIAQRQRDELEKANREAIEQEESEREQAAIELRAMVWLRGDDTPADDKKMEPEQSEQIITIG